MLRLRNTRLLNPDAARWQLQCHLLTLRFYENNRHYFCLRMRYYVCTELLFLSLSDPGTAIREKERGDLLFATMSPDDQFSALQQYCVWQVLVSYGAIRNFKINYRTLSTLTNFTLLYRNQLSIITTWIQICILQLLNIPVHKIMSQRDVRCLHCRKNLKIQSIFIS